MGSAYFTCIEQAVENRTHPGGYRHFVTPFSSRYNTNGSFTPYFVYHLYAYLP
jgi:hypothetical protein